MITRGDCLCCTKLGRCRLTSLEKTLGGYTCSLFEAADEAVYVARWQLMKQYGEEAAVNAMLKTGEREDA